jgi:hypothetical protein
MSIIDIYHQGRKIESKSFQNESFYIVKDLDGVLYWETDREQAKNKRGGVIEIWIQTGYTLSFVKPDWQLTVDGVQLPQKFHDTVNVTGKQIRLQHEDYEFVCQFPEAG